MMQDGELIAAVCPQWGASDIAMAVGFGIFVLMIVGMIWIIKDAGG